MTGANRHGTLHCVADLARGAHLQFTPTELQDTIDAPPALGDTFDDILAEVSWLADRPLRIPNTGRRP